MIESKFLIAWGNVADTATLSGGSWTNLNNLKDYRLNKLAKSQTEATSSTTFRVVLAAPAHVGVLALINVNATPDAQCGWRIYPDGTWTTPEYDSQLADVYPPGTVPFGTIPYGAPNWWTGRPTVAELNRYQRSIVHVLPDARYAQYLEFYLSDAAGLASLGYFSAGRLMVAQALQPVSNVLHGDAKLQAKSRSTTQRAVDGTSYFDVRRPDFTLPFSLARLTRDEAMRLLDMQLTVDVSGEVLAMWNPLDPAYAYRRQVFGRLAELDAITHPRFATYGASFQVEGQLP